LHIVQWKEPDTAWLETQERITPLGAGVDKNRK
jgi:hypothetical protein